ncbi:MAG: serine/threonine-protein phosphatase, partial [Armatimonadetes bacterium]|nr:serine/threonine-protein phosphatase [Armatimonadota bacterium]
AVRGAVMGAYAEAEYEPVALVLSPGDMVILTTDGITEARSTDKKFFELAGIARCVENALSTAPDESPEPIAQACLRSAKEWANGKLSDDACLLIARFIGMNTNITHEKNDRQTTKDRYVHGTPSGATIY